MWLVRIASGLPTRTKPLARCPTTGPTFPWHAIVSKGGECGCTGQQFENATPGNCYHLPAGAAFLCSTKVCA